MSEVNKKKWGDRRDARKIKMNGMMRLCTYLKDRHDADVYINKKIDVTELVKYMKKKKKSEPETTYFHAFSMASAVGIYWIASTLFTIAQNLLVERKKVK